MSEVERRGAVRVPARLAMQIVVGEDSARVETINVSASGVYFATSSYIAPLTKLRIVLDLPAGKDEAPRADTVACEGVVVRVEPEEYSPSVKEYQVACYFTDVSDQDTLESYVLGHAPF